jgi:hypothetical protein
VSTSSGISLPDVLPPQEAIQVQDIRSLPGKLDTVPVFNSNSPEIVQMEGVLLSTFPPIGTQAPNAHLNYAFQGRFDVFAHHIVRARTAYQTRTMFLGLLVGNPNSSPVTIDVLQAASYLTNPEARFIDLPAQIEDPIGRIFAGPGSRTMGDILRGRRLGNIPTRLVIPPGQYDTLANLPIPVGSVVPASNGRSLLMRLSSDGPVYLASLAMYAPSGPGRRERAPTVADWQTLLRRGRLVSPRDLTPTPKTSYADGSRVIYGRVAGVAQGSRWEATVTDNPTSQALTIPKRGLAFSYGLSTLPRGTLGTGQVQSAPMLARYPDTAYLSHGNYGVEYSLKLPLHNPLSQEATVVVTIQTPLKEDEAKNKLRFFQPPEDRVFFRGTVRVSYTDSQGSSTQVRYFHLVQRRGQSGEPLLKLTLRPEEKRNVQVDLLYPPDATPPQVLTVRTLGTSGE